MANVVVVGAQWGDEGKGKATDLLGGRVDYVVKPNGGNNAGHTVVVNGEKFELKLLPAGILSPNAVPVIGNGVVVNLEALFEEIDGLESRGHSCEHLKISANAHLVAPYHQTMDKVTERFLGKRAIGTTGRGIGPTYMDKVARLGIRVQDVLDESILRQKIEGALRQKNELLVKLYNRRAFEVDEIAGVAPSGNLDLDMDPKLAWALANRADFPLDVNRASREMLLRVPGFGTKTVNRILGARRHAVLRYDDLARLGAVMKKARAFVSVPGWSPKGLIDSADLRARFAPPAEQLQLI